MFYGECNQKLFNLVESDDEDYVDTQVKYTVKDLPVAKQVVKYQREEEKAEMAMQSAKRVYLDLKLKVKEVVEKKKHSETLLQDEQFEQELLRTVEEYFGTSQEGSEAALKVAEKFAEKVKQLEENGFVASDVLFQDKGNFNLTIYNFTKND